MKSKFSLLKSIEETPNNVIEHDLYNEHNKLITKNQIESILQYCGINETINNVELYQRAFTHKSYIEKDDCVKIIENTVNALPLQKKSYERLEFLGDSVVGLIVVGYLYERFFDQNEGVMTRYKSNLVNNHYYHSLIRHNHRLLFHIHLLIYLLVPHLKYYHLQKYYLHHNRYNHLLD